MASNDLAGTLEGEVKLESKGDEFFHVIGGKAHRLPDLISHGIQSIGLHAGDWKTDGSIKNWTYFMDGKVESFKEKLKVDEETKTVTAEAIGGDVMKHYKKYIITIKVVPNEDGSKVAKYSIDYEKLNENDPTPTKYLEWIGQMIKDLDASLAKPIFGIL
ncbi:OLC1v1032059C1 [Oldenlandia corymbosa var. corymbosa]|uniref:OLC1v1032059C1 n=1 Tax=Oldenlandia corymbosa var. corymbosa TaxID=529605 RepID=A0AAV1CK22_OLDCO|nr:OLC1v1032059C1 [Oldenlandia corymbosa var. corymbosa]